MFVEHPGMTYKLTLPCTRAEAEALAGEMPMLDALEAPPVLVTSEPDPSRADEWRLDAYFEAEPDAATIELIVSLISSASERPEVAPLPEDDWVTLSQAGLEPIRAGRFFVHTPRHRGQPPLGSIALKIDAGRAFGTGHHETTAGCLEALTRLADEGRGFSNIIDVGTGTGVLAFAAKSLWPDARVLASDNDRVAVEVAAANAANNGIKGVAVLVAEGMDHREIAARGRFGLIIANILAGPLMALAPSFATALAPGAALILAGLLDGQAGAVANAYRDHGLEEGFSIDGGGWPTLVLRNAGRDA